MYLDDIELNSLSAKEQAMPTLIAVNKKLTVITLLDMKTESLPTSTALVCGGLYLAMSKAMGRMRTSI